MLSNVLQSLKDTNPIKLSNKTDCVSILIGKYISHLYYVYNDIITITVISMLLLNSNYYPLLLSKYNASIIDGGPVLQSCVFRTFRFLHKLSDKHDELINVCYDIYFCVSEPH